ncbi:MAG: chemotaxis protein MotB [Ignavibacteriales bacterium CG_4_9_14_3_um_filter_34_10]|nr:MAG: chemotaxis protein MotB [Ignavibacteriales bacterium CG_4_9_14_3_um_filter_34_10]
MADNDKPIIFKKVKKGGEGHHGGAWKVAYADFVTAMMALFIVLWVLNQSEDVKKAVSNYFKDPTGYSQYGKNIIIGQSSGFMPKKGTDLHTGKGKSKEEQKKKFEEMKEQIKKELSKNKVFTDIENKIKFEIVNEGLRIEMLETEDNFFFDIGSSRLNIKAIEVLKKIAKQISSLPNLIVVEGHTDARPFAAGNESYTNYELSADRANSARRVLIENNISTDKIDEIRGYADKRLRDSENPFSLVNRRISIVLKYMK